MFDPQLDPDDIERQVRAALAEDIGSGDVTALLIPAGRRAVARVIAREPGVVCGRPWVDEVFRQVEPGATLRWHCNDGDPVGADQVLLEVDGPARAIVTGERTALNFLQALSGTATVAATWAALVAGSALRILDTRKTLPGLRTAQKYAVRCGGCHNHRMGLFDAFLIKENHIAAAGSIEAAVSSARSLAPGRPVEVEVETLAELDAALDAGADVVMLDEFDLETTRSAVERTAGRAKLEVSGSVTPERLAALVSAGVDYVSVGALTKHVRALDLSMRIIAVDDETRPSAGEQRS